MPLSFGEENATYKIVRITGKDEVRAHLQNLGLVEQGLVSVIQSSSGNLIVEARGARMALGRDLARRIQIQPL